MIKVYPKILLLTLFACCVSFMAKAQSGYDFSVYDIGFSAGLNSVSGDIKPTKLTPSVNINLTYNATPYTNFVFEAQLGRFAGGDSVKTAGPQFTSTFSAFVLRGQLQFGEFLNYDGNQLANGFKNLYVSVGAGYMVNHVTVINRTSTLAPGSYFPGQDNINVPFIPFRIGYEFKLFNKYQQPSVKVDLAYQYGYLFNDNLDGYTSGANRDSFSQFSIGVKFALGGNVLSYRKQIQY
jgi:hypothetical protein